MNFTAIDFETANSNRSSICSVGIAVVENGRLIGSEHIYVKPTPNYYDSYNTYIHGINDSHTRSKGTFKEQWNYLRPYFHNRTIIAHNASFDTSVLRFTLDQGKLEYPELDYHCTYRLSKETLNLRGHKLSDVSRHFNIRLQHHNAESDARASALIAIKLCEKHGVGTLQELSTGLGFKIGKISPTSKYKPFSKK